MTLEELTAELTAQKETIQQLLVQQQEEREEREQRDAPVGTIAAFGGTADRIPPHWLLCDGRSLRAGDFLLLSAAIGTSWGAGDNPPDTFRLPDLRGMFLRGVDGGTGNDPDVTSRSAAGPGGHTQGDVGSIQVDAFGGHSHVVNDPTHTHGVGDPGHAHSFDFFDNGHSGNGNPGSDFPRNGRQSGTHLSSTGVSILASSTGISLQRSGGNETRPKNAYVFWIIKGDPR
jgi:microcystin-dependent protein